MKEMDIVGLLNAYQRGWIVREYPTAEPPMLTVASRRTESRGHIWIDGSIAAAHRPSSSAPIREGSSFRTTQAHPQVRWNDLVEFPSRALPVRSANASAYSEKFKNTLWMELSRTFHESWFKVTPGTPSPSVKKRASV